MSMIAVCAWRKSPSSKSPWGVMRTFISRTISGRRQFQIPMRGYEAYSVSDRSNTLRVPNPHEGLWDADLSFWIMRQKCSKSPWGVMSYHKRKEGQMADKFQIPMRGYEKAEAVPGSSWSSVPNPHEGLWGINAHRQQRRKSSSKSPWGVMRMMNWFGPTKKWKFQIPMRGYEVNRYLAALSVVMVPNPHEGLWGKESLFKSLLKVPNPHEGLWGLSWSLLILLSYVP